MLAVTSSLGSRLLVRLVVGPGGLLERLAHLREVTGEDAQPSDQLGRELPDLLGVRRQGVFAPAQLYHLKEREHRRGRCDHHPLSGGVLEQQGVALHGGGERGF